MVTGFGNSSPQHQKKRRIRTPTQKGLSERKDEYSNSIDMNRHMLDVVDLIKTENIEAVHLVGWSYAAPGQTDIAESCQHCEGGYSTR